MTRPDHLARVRSRLNAARRRLALGELATGLLLTLAGGTLIWLLVTLVEALLRLPAVGRWILFGFVFAGVGGLTVRYLLLPGLRWAGIIGGLGDDAVASRVGAAFPEVRDRLLNLLQLLDGRHSAAPSPLVEEAASRLGVGLAQVPVERVEDFSGVRRAGRLASLPVVALLAFALLANDQFLGASARVMAPASTFEDPPTYSLSVTPGNVSVVKGADVPVSARLSGSGWPEEILLEYRFTDETVSETVPMSAPPEAEYEFINVRESLVYRILAGRVESDWFELDVTDRPVVSRLSVALRFPSYTRLPAQQLPENDGTVTALVGTRVAVDALVTGPEISTATLIFGSGRQVELAGNGRSWRGEFTVRGDDTWRLQVESLREVRNADPIDYRIRSSQDGAPTVSFLAPESAVDLDESASVDVAWRITDDYGFSGLRLHYRLDESRFGEPSDSFMVMTLPVSDPYLLDQTGAVNWRLVEDTGLDPVPGDVFSYFLEVTDNNRVSGFSSARTPLYTLRMPSLAERFEALDDAEDETQEELEELIDEARRVREQFEELKEELRSKTESEWEDERALEQLMEEQRALEESVEEIADQIEELTEEMDRNELVSEETLELFEELKEVADEVNTPELMDALDNLQEAMEQMNLQQMQESLEDFEFAENLYQQRLERTLELFKNLRVQQDLEEAARRAEDLAETEEQLAQETESLDEEAMDGQEREERAEELAQEQERASEEMQQLEEKLDEIGERMEDLENAPNEAMDELSDDTKRQNMPEQMQENAEQMREQQFDQAQQQQQNMSQNLQQLQQDLQQMQQGMQGAQMQMNTAGLRRALDDVLGLSNDEETLRAEVQDLAADSPRLRETAQQQLRLSEGLSIVADSLQSLARTIPQMGRDVQIHAGEAMREMGDATQAMTDRAARRASGHQKGAMTHLNELALMLADLLDQMMNGQGSGGNMSMEQFMEQLQNMSGQQNLLNQQIQQLLNDMQGNRLTQDMQERLRQMSGQQEQIRRDLRQLSRERSLRTDALGDLERIAEQMQETIEELQQQRLSRRTTQRQQQILTRLLEASRSMQERGRERRRESRSGEQINRASPSELTPSEQAEQLRRDLIRALERGYAPDYEEMIRRYFDLLSRQQSGSSQ